MGRGPTVLEGLPETSFEDLDTSLRKGEKHSSSSSNNNHKLILGHIPGLIPTPSSTTSSEDTTFSRKALVDGDTAATRSDSVEGEEEEEEDDDGDEFEFLNDFKEFQIGKDNLDQALRSNFVLRSSPPVAYKGLSETKPTSGLRQPRSMMDLQPSNRLAGSKSLGNLRRSTIRFKKSMPSLSQYPRADSRLNEFKENADVAEDDDLLFDESLLQPQFLTQNKKNNIHDDNRRDELPIRLSPSQYDIIRDDTLLTPRLHKRKSLRDRGSYNQLNTFREHHIDYDPPRHGRKHVTAASRIRTIKQEIDSNTPLKNGKMFYNPDTMKWEGNEQILEKFRDIENFDKKPLLIRSKPYRTKSDIGIKPLDNKQYKTNNNSNTSNNSRKPRVVGKMMFDEENLRWVSVNGPEDEEDVFASIEDIPIANNKPSTRQQATHPPFFRSQIHQVVGDRFISAGTTRFHSLGGDKELSSENDSTFQLSAHLLESFYHEENRWIRKVSSWFDQTDLCKDGKGHHFATKRSKNYMFEIRKMVINSTRR